MQACLAVMLPAFTVTLEAFSLSPRPPLPAKKAYGHLFFQFPSLSYKC